MPRLSPDRPWFRLRFALLLIAGWIALVAAQPDDAAAAQVELRLWGSHGYAIEVKGAAGKVTLLAMDPTSAVRYRVPGRVTRRTISARFGRLGKVDMRFKPGRRAKIETPARRCKGDAHTTRWGAFVGVIRFRGERGFTRVRARRATGNVTVSPRWKCQGRGGHKRAEIRDRGIGLLSEPEDPVTLELLDRRHRVEGGAFTVGRGTGFSFTLCFAGVRERRGRMRINRSALAFAEADSFVFDTPLTRAVVAPPWPFTGKGRFKRDPGGRTSWTGPLSVALPGTERISLTEPRFRARLYRRGKNGIADPGL